MRNLLARQSSSLSEYNYRVFFAGQSVSLIGTWMQTVGQGWLVLQLTGSAVALGVVTMLQMLPFTLLSLVDPEPYSLGERGTGSFAHSRSVSSTSSSIS